MSSAVRNDHSSPDDAPVVAVVASGSAARPPASAAEVAAVVAALSVFTGGVSGNGVAPATPRWRFSGRWWTKPLPQRRDRP